MSKKIGFLAFSLCSNLKNIEINSYKTFCLLGVEDKKLSISSTIRNYNSGKFKANEKEINKIKKYILERRLELLFLAITNEDYNLLNNLLNEKIYNKEEIDMYIQKIIELKISQKSPEIVNTLLQYKNDNFEFDNINNTLDYLNLDEDVNKNGKDIFRK